MIKSDDGRMRRMIMVAPPDETDPGFGDDPDGQDDHDPDTTEPVLDQPDTTGEVTA